MGKFGARLKLNVHCCPMILVPAFPDCQGQIWDEFMSTLETHNSKGVKTGKAQIWGA